MDPSLAPASTLESEPITEDMMSTAIREEEEALQTSLTVDYSTYKPTPLTEAKELRLSFKRIPAISNLDALSKLVELRLDNNRIKKIEGLDSLVNLQFLDLSFNHIKKIEGLDKLAKLKDLSLYGNKIKKIEGLDGCRETLEIISLGGNDIESPDSLLYFRKFPKLRALSVDGNPLCGANTEYRTHAVAFLTQLHYVDFELVRPDERRAAREGGVPLEEIQRVEDKDRDEAAERAASEELQARVEELGRHGLQAAAAPFAELFRDDSDWVKLQNLPGVTELVVTFKEQSAELAAEFVKEGKKRSQAIEGEIEQFRKAMAAVVGEAERKASSLVNGFLRRQKVVFRDFRSGIRPWLIAVRKELDDNPDGPFTPLNLEPLRSQRPAVEVMIAELLEIEVDLAAKTRRILDAFESALGELRDLKLQAHQAFFRGMEAGERGFAADVEERLQHIYTEVSRSLAGDEDGNNAVSSDASLSLKRSKFPSELQDLSDDMVAIVTDRDELMSLAKNSNDLHNRRLNDAEDAAIKWEKLRCATTIDQAREQESERSRLRGREIDAIRQAADAAITDEFERTLDRFVVSDGDEFIPDVVLPSLGLDPSKFLELDISDILHVALE